MLIGPATSPSRPAEPAAGPSGGPAPPPVGSAAQPRRLVAAVIRTRPAVISAAIAVVVLMLAGFLSAVVAGGDSGMTSWVSNLGQLAAAGLATVAAARAAARGREQRRLWLLISVACGLWTVGQAVWCFYELRGQQIPDVSAADPFFMAFAGLVAVAVWPAHGRRSDRVRTLLDAAIIGMSLFVISWVTSLRTVAPIATAETSATLTRLIDFAYPAVDIVILTIMLLAASYRHGRYRCSLSLLAMGMTLIAVGDNYYAHLSSIGRFTTEWLSGLGWSAGFGVLACAALFHGRPSATAMRSEHVSVTDLPATARAQSSMLPYFPLAVALAVVAVDRWNNGIDRVSGIVVIATFIGVLIRQYLTIQDNVALTGHLVSRERELAQQAFYDQLTGLPNRALFVDRVERALQQHRATGRQLALLFVDLDDFKAVNDTFGHPVGDDLVISVAERLRAAVRATDTVARFGGDEFAVLVAGDVSGIEVGNRLIETTGRPYLLGPERVSVGASIGIAEVTELEPTPQVEDLVTMADTAMYAAKRAGKGRVVAYDPAMELPESTDLQYRALLIDDVHAGAVDCVFQPIVDLGSARVRFMQAQARWRVGGDPVDQAYFLDLAGRLGLLPALTELTMGRACSQLADWTARFGCNSLQVAVSVPSGLMSDVDFPGRVAALLRRHGLGTHRLVLDLTEEAFTGNIVLARGIAAELRRLGVQLWLAEFGTGLSSMVSLRQIPLQGVKIDIGFVDNIDADPSAQRFLWAMLALGGDLGMVVTAEGVERPGQADVLRALGCQFAQGPLYSPPAPAAEFESLLRSSFCAVPPGASMAAPGPVADDRERLLGIPAPTAAL